MANKILHIEDDADTRDLVKLLLKKADFDVESVGDGKECLDKLRNEEFNLILLDIMLPDMSGWDIFQKIKKMQLNNNPKIIFLSVIPVSEERREVLRKDGIFDYITKPFDNKDLIRRVSTALK